MANATATNITASHPYYCASLWPLDMPWSHLTAWAVVTGILSPITIIANSTLIYGLLKTQQLTTITNKFILIMNVSDLCTGLFVLPLIVVMVCLKDTIRSCAFELFMQYIAFVLAYFSFFMLMSISVDRYIHVTKLNKYNQFMNGFRMKLVTVVSFVCSALIGYIAIAFPAFWLQVTLNLSDLAGVSLMFFLYSLVFRKIAVHTEKFRKMLEELGTNESTSRETKKEVSATKTIRFVLGALLVLYLPYNICSAAWSYYKFNKKVNPPLFLNAMAYWSYIIVFSNAAINAVIFGYGNSVVRKFIFSKFCRVDNEVFPLTITSTVRPSDTLPVS